MKKGTKGTKKGATNGSPPTTMDAIYYSHYLEQTKKSGEHTAILLQVGKFFEMYDSVNLETGESRANVQTIAEVCGCSVDPKPSTVPGQGRVFWGFPESSLPKFERILVNAGYTVVVIVQIKDATNVVTSRSIDHISSPGTFWDAEGGLAVRRDEQILLGIYIEPSVDKCWHVATTAFDIMTGNAMSTEAVIALIDGKPVLDSLQPFWSMYPPAELVVDWCSATPAPKEQDLRSLFASFGKRIPIHIRTVCETKENSVVQDRLRLAFFSEIFKIKSALSIEEYLEIRVYHFIRRSLYHLFQFVNDHNPSFLTSLHTHRIWTPEENVLLGNAALEQLAMIATHADKPHESLLFWLQKATTTMGKRTLRERCLKPSADIEELEERQERIACLRAEDRTILEKTLKGCFDLPRLYRRFQLRRGTTSDLLQLLSTYEKAIVLVKETQGKLYGSEDSVLLTNHIQSLLERWDAERIRGSIDRMQSVDGIVVGSFHPWRRGCHADLDALEDQWIALESEMSACKALWEGWIEDTKGIDWTLREDSPFLFTTTARRAAALSVAAKRNHVAITSSKRGSSTTVTLESERLAAANAQGIKLRREWRALVEERWHQDWTEWMTVAMDESVLENLTEFMGRIDAECTFARISDAYGYVRPTYVPSTEEAVAGLRIEGLRHPIIERIHADTPYISHNLAFGSLASGSGEAGEDGASSKAGILLYGVNAAGKSSLGKALGLAVLMAQCGIPVPASAMTLIPYTGVFTRILGNDNLWAGMSSFVVEMTEFRSILRSANGRTLVIGDELCAGTETASATAIVAAGIQTLSSRSTHFLFATHLHELADIPEIVQDPNVVSYHLTVQPDLEHGVLVYDRALRRGCGSAMYGLEVCRGLDMDKEFLRRAIAFRKQYFSENGKAHVSSYNARVVVQACEVCGSKEKLETHHIVPQSLADEKKRIFPWKHMNARENLVSLCDGCHAKHHAGGLDIQGWVQTTEGRKMRIGSG